MIGRLHRRGLPLRPLRFGFPSLLLAQDSLIAGKLRYVVAEKRHIVKGFHGLLVDILVELRLSLLEFSLKEREAIVVDGIAVRGMPATSEICASQWVIIDVGRNIIRKVRKI